MHLQGASLRAVVVFYGSLSCCAIVVFECSIGKLEYMLEWYAASALPGDAPKSTAHLWRALAREVHVTVN